MRIERTASTHRNTGHTCGFGWEKDLSAAQTSPASFSYFQDPLIIFPYFDSRRGENHHWFPIKKKFKDLGRQHKYPRIDSRGRKLKQQKEVFVAGYWVASIIWNFLQILGVLFSGTGISYFFSTVSIFLIKIQASWEKNQVSLILCHTLSIINGKCNLHLGATLYFNN